MEVKFLLTPLREGRPSKGLIPIGGIIISTHAPAGGATMLCHYQCHLVLNFYSRPCGRGDLKN